jgi:protein-S-isoprenylcysteine O-methyltransferase Ste14
VAVIDRFQVAAEERALADRFGDDYAAYRANVPRWLGLRSIIG